MGAFAPSGTITDLAIVGRQIGWLRRAIQRNAMTSAATISALVYSEFGTLNTLIGGSASNQDLSARPTLALNYNLDPDFGIANSDGSAGADAVVISST